MLQGFLFPISWTLTSGAETAFVRPLKLAAALVRPYSPVLGPRDAPVTIVEFFDPACEACRALHSVVKSVMADHGDSVRVVLRYTPFHGEASVEAIRVLEAARMQGMFVPVLGALFHEQPQWASHGRMRPELIFPIVQTDRRSDDARSRYAS